MTETVSCDLSLSTVVARAELVISLEGVDGRGTYILGPDDEVPLFVTDSAEMIWAALASPIRVDELVAKIAGPYSESKEVVGRDVLPWLSDLVDKALISTGDDA